MSVLSSVLAPALFSIPPLYLVVLLLLGAAGLVPQRLQRPMSAAAMLLAYGCAAAILLLHAGERIAHFRLEGLRWSLASVGGEPRDVAVGGTPEDELYVEESAYRAGSFLIQLRNGGLWLDRGPGYDGRQVVRIGDRIAGLHPISDGARIQLGKAEAQLRQGGLFGSRTELSTGGNIQRLPARHGKLPLLDLSFAYFVYPGPTARLYPIVPGKKSRIAFGVLGGDKEINSAGLLVLENEASVDGQPLRSFPVEVPKDAAVQFLAVKSCSDPVDRSRNPCLRPVLGFSRFHLDAEAETLTASLARPRTVALRLGKDEDRVVFSVRGSAEERLVQFGDLSRSFSTVVATLHLGASGFRAETAQEEIDAAYGQSVALGRRDQLLVNVATNGDVGLPLRVLLATALVSVVLGWRLLGNWSHTALLGAAAVLSSMRLLFGWAAASLPPFSRESLELAVYLLPLAPAFVIGTAALVQVLRARSARHEAQAGAGLANGCAAILFAAAAGAAQVRGQHLAAALGLPIGMLACLAAAVFLPSQMLLRSAEKLERWLGRAPYGSLALLAVAAYGLRAALLFLFGFKEELPLGGAALRLSVLYVPLLVVLLALGCAAHLKALGGSPALGQSAAASARRLAVGHFVLYCGLIVGLHLLSGFLSSDLGTFIHVLPAFVLLAAIGWETSRRLPRREGRGAILLLVAPAILVVVFLLSPRWMLLLGELVAERDFKLDNAEEVVREQNQLRFLQYLNPDRVREMGIRASEAIAQEAAIRESYLRQGLLGAGYLQVPVPPTFQSTCLNDNVAAVYGMGQFGLFGGAALVLAYTALMGVALRPGPQLPETQLRRFGDSLSILAALTLAGTSLYMIGANAHLLPFTGRNLYFLGLNSFSDIVEAGLLLCFAAATTTEAAA